MGRWGDTIRCLTGVHNHRSCQGRTLHQHGEVKICSSSSVEDRQRQTAKLCCNRPSRACAMRGNPDPLIELRGARCCSRNDRPGDGYPRTRRAPPYESPLQPLCDGLFLLSAIFAAIRASGVRTELLLPTINQLRANAPASLVRCPFLPAAIVGTGPCVSAETAPCVGALHQLASDVSVWPARQ